jgi:multidrug resistance efflux pump
MMQIAISKNNVEDLETNLRDIKRRLMEEQTLFEQGSSTRSQYDSLQLQYSRGEVSLKNAILSLQKSKKEINRTQISMKNSQLSLERSQRELEKAEEALEDTQLNAKIEGIIIGKSFEEGEVISPGAVLFQIINIKQVEIPILVDEADLPLIQEGQPVVFTTPSYRDKEFPGIIDRISWSSDPETGRFPLYVKAANPGLKLRAGMSAKVYFMRQK